MNNQEHYEEEVLRGSFRMHLTAPDSENELRHGKSRIEPKSAFYIYLGTSSICITMALFLLNIIRSSANRNSAIQRKIEINTNINKTLFKCLSFIYLFEIGLSNQTRSQHNLTVKQLNGRTVEQGCIQHQSELFQFLNSAFGSVRDKFSLVIWSLDPRLL
ncbi:hypothetical protein BpHYR1_046230 [Brachionus plicatilis]|uniref:Uncharacterized protein n=1 Tax=Brachionus plicatilis TaxID=10195 RepID=A0A3M7T819_BRAPC|nr:hypothetical protein BpHYR1_046230 [Brachionus plicatilis]